MVNMRLKKWNVEYIINSLALLSIVTLLLDLSFELNDKFARVLENIDLIIWIVFAVDYFYRLYKSSSKKEFIFNNKIDLIAILPINAMFKSLRAIKIFKLAKLSKLSKLTRLLVYLKRYTSKTSSFMKESKLNYIIYITGVTIILGAIGISFVEEMPFYDSIWWSFVTTTTVGYGDLSPTTAIGRIIACVLMIVGIGFVSILTGNLASYLLNSKDEVKTYKDDVLIDIKSKLDNFEDLSNDDIDNICKVLKGLKSD